MVTPVEVGTVSEIVTPVQLEAVQRVSALAPALELALELKELVSVSVVLERVQQSLLAVAQPATWKRFGVGHAWRRPSESSPGQRFHRELLNYYGNASERHSVFWRSL